MGTKDDRISFIFLIPYLMEFSQLAVNRAKKMKGYLEKKSSGFISLWQKRYFIVFDERLTYFQDETLQEEKKTILISSINTIKVVEDTQFYLVTKKRVYELRADSEKNRDLWVASLNIIISQYQQNQSVPSPKSRQSVGKQPALTSFSPKLKSSSHSSPFSPAKLPEIKKILSESDFSPQSFFDQVGLSKIASKWKEESIQNKVLLMKMPKLCYFIISCKTLPNSHEDQDFMEEQLIIPYDFNTLYLYQYGKGENRKVLQVCKCFEITAVEQENKGLVLIVSDKTYSLNFDSKKISWESKSEAYKKIVKSIQISKEYHNSLEIKLKRNIDKMLFLYDSNQMSLSDLVKRQVERTLTNVKETNSKNQFRKTLELLKKNIKEIMNCCEVQGALRADFKVKYVREFHKEVMNYVHKHWLQVQKACGLNENKKVILILYDFWKCIKDIVKDNKLFEASILMHKMLMEKYQEELLSKIDSCFSLKEDELLEEISIELKGESEIIEKMENLFFSNSIYRQLHIDIRLVLYEFPEMPISEQILHEYLTLFRNVFKRIAEQTFKVFDKWQNIDLIVGTCNQIEVIKNSLFEQMYSKLISEYKSMGNLIQNTYIRQIESQISNSETLLVKNLFVTVFSTIDRGMLSKNFDQFDVEQLCKQILIKMSRFKKMNKYVKRNVYEASFQEICYFYYSVIIKFSRNNRQKHTSEFFIKKISDDVKIIGKHFQPHVNDDKIHAHLKDLTLLKDFLQNDVEQLRKICQHIKKQFGNSFTEQAVTNLLAMRDMSQEIRDNLVLQFGELVKSSADSLEEISIMSSSRESFLDNWNNARSRKSTLTLSINEFIENQQTIHQSKYNCSVWKQGYLFLKKIDKTMVSSETMSFFKISQCRIEEYPSDKCEKIINIYDLKNVKKCCLHHDKNYIFFVDFYDFKLQFKAETSDEAKEWVRNIIEENGALSTLEQIPIEKERHSELCVEIPQHYDPSTIDTNKMGKSPQIIQGDSPMLKKKKASSPDKEKEPTSPDRIVWMEKSPKAEKGKKKVEDEENCFKCSKGFFF